MTSGVERMYMYMDAVESGTIPACREVKQAVARQRRDLAREDSPWWFDEEKADRVVRFVELLPHVKGRQFVGKNLKMEPWQCFILCVVFGWVDIDDIRRFKAVYIEVPRKNAKSTLTSAIGLYLLVADDEPGAEVYSAATGVEQAKIVFGSAKQMVDKTQAFRDNFGAATYGGAMQAGSIVVMDTASSFRPLARDSGGNLDGLNVHGGLIDELHAHKTRDIYDVIETGTGARQQPLIWAITTAGSNRAGICYEQRGYVKRILNKTVDDDRYFGIIYTIDKGYDDIPDDDWTQRSSWMKANPNWGISVEPDDMERLASKAISTSSAQNNFLTKRLNVWVNAGEAWMNMIKFEKCVRAIDWDDMKGYPLWIALDLASRVDIAAINYTWLKDGQYWSKSRYYIPQDTVEEETNASYSGWTIDEYLIETQGGKTDFSLIEKQLLEDFDTFSVQGIAYDPYQAQYLVNNLSDSHIDMIEYRQTVANMSEPMKQWEGFVNDGKFFYDGNPVTTWMVANVVCRIDEKDNVYPRKELRENKIDGAVAQIMTLGLMLTEEESDSVIFL